MKIKKKLLSAILSAAVTASALLVPITANAANGTWSNGTAGSGTWTYDTDTKTLVISGTGTANRDSSWSNSYWNQVTHLVLDKGITATNTDLFDYQTAIKTIVWEDGAPIISRGINCHNPNLEVIRVPSSVTEFGYAFISDTSENKYKNLKIYYTGTQEQWEAIDRTKLTATIEQIDKNATRYYNSDCAIIHNGSNYMVAAALGETNGSAAISPHNASYGSNVTFTASANEGYHFVGWYNGDTQVSTANPYTTAITAATELTAKFTDKTYTITYNNDGTETTETAIYGQALPSIEVPAKADYTFGGYYTEQSGSGTQYYDSNGAAQFETSALTEDITLYAFWTQTPASVSGTVEAVVADNTGKDNEGNTDNGATGFVTLLTKSGIPDFTISKITWAVTSPANDNAQQTFEKVPETTITLTGTDASVKVALVIDKLYDANATANITVE